MSITCTRRIEFDAAHRVMKHEHKCALLHGHRYVIEASFSAKELDALGRVIDFGVIRTKLQHWVDTHWDHNTILHEADRALGESIATQTGQKIYYLPFNPTAENMARYLMEKISREIFPGDEVQCVSLRLYETPNCYAEVRL